MPIRLLAACLCVHALLAAAAPAHAQSRELSESYQRGAALYRAGKPEEAIAPIERALALSEVEFGVDSSRTGFILNNLGVLYRTVGRHAAAAPVLQRALAIVDRTLGPDDALTAQVVNELSIVHVALGDYERAEPMLRRVFVYLERAAGPEDPRIATAAYNLAYAAERLGRREDARPLYERAYAIWRTAQGPDDPDTLAAAARLASVDGRAGPQRAEAVGTATPSPPSAVPAGQVTPPRALLWRVQLGALRSRSAAEAEAARLGRAYGDLMDVPAPAIARADLEQGTYYRLVLGPFGEVGAAKDLCRNLRARGQACFVAAAEKNGDRD